MGVQAWRLVSYTRYTSCAGHSRLTSGGTSEEPGTTGLVLQPMVNAGPPIVLAPFSVPDAPPPGAPPVPPPGPRYAPGPGTVAAAASASAHACITRCSVVRFVLRGCCLSGELLRTPVGVTAHHETDGKQHIIRQGAEAAATYACGSRWGEVCWPSGIAHRFAHPVGSTHI